MSAFLLIIEGPDGVGKSTFCRTVTALLAAQGADVIGVMEPTDRSCITADDPIAAFAEDRKALYLQTVLPALKAGKVVVSDRSVYSSIAYQGQGGSRNINRVLEENHATGLLGALATIIQAGHQSTVVLLPSAPFRSPSAAIDSNDADPALFAAVRAAYDMLTNGHGLMYVDDSGQLQSLTIPAAIVLGDEEARDKWALSAAIVARGVLSAIARD